MPNSDASAVLSLLEDSDILDIRQAVVDQVKTKGVNAICRQLVASSASGGTSTYNFACSLGDLAAAINAEINIRGIKVPGTSRRFRNRAVIRMRNCF